jgi:chorismate synthase
VVTTGGTLSGLAASANPLVYTATFTPTAGIQNTSASITMAAPSPMRPAMAPLLRRRHR